MIRSRCFRYFLVLFFLSLAFPSLAQQAKYKEMVQYDSVLKVMPREKLYMQLDKSVYAMGDTIWFKGYLINASLLNYSLTSGLIYAEMINKNGEVVQTLSLPTQYGLTWGGFALDPNKYEAGSYTFRAYTNWMQNFGDAFLFKKEIQLLAIAIPQPEPTSTQTIKMLSQKASQAAITKKQSIDLQFLPEGGTWIAERPQKLAYKAIAANGKGIAVEGNIMDSKQQKISSFKSNALGMGYAEFTPKTGETYTANFKSAIGNGNENLPKVQANGVTLKVNNNLGSDSIGIAIFSDLANQELTLLGQARGVLCFLAKIKPGATYKTIHIAKSVFPTGVSQILIKNAQEQILNERAFFINHHDELKVKLTSSQTSFSVRDSIPLHLKVTDQAGNPIAGSFSLAVTDDGQVKKDSLNDANILSYLLMSSDLKGEIETPGYYFNGVGQQQHEDLEALMLTQGWVSYQSDLSKKPAYKAEKELTITGKITNIANKPIAKAKITMLSTRKLLMLMDTVTNDKGEFLFRNFPIMDSVAFVIQALNAKGNRGTLGIEMEEFKRPAITVASKKPIVATDEPIDSISAQLMANQRQSASFGNGGIALREVKITGKKIIKRSKNLNGPGEADQTLTDADLEKLNKKTLLNVLEEKVQGFRAGTRRKSMVRDYMVNTAIVKLIIDGIDVDFFFSPSEMANSFDEHYQHIKFYLDYYTAEDVQGIEIMRYPRNSGSYRMEFLQPLDDTEYAFIEITTKTGSGPFLKKSANMYIYKPQPYGDNKIFYSPRYTVANKTDKKPDLRSTIYWIPNLPTDKNGEAKTSFFSSDKKGTYTAWLEGSDMDGNFGFKAIQIVIK